MLPADSLRVKRGRVVRWAVVLCLGVIVYTMAGHDYGVFLSPGALSSTHGSLGRNCGACHSAHQGGPLAWLQATLTPTDGRGEDRLCLECHALQENARTPHNRSAAFLQESRQRLTQQAAGEGTASLPARVDVAQSMKDGADAPPCAFCHEEHQGPDAAFSRMDNQQCQSCHSLRFAGFGQGHPEFTDFPSTRRTRVVFDHVSHFGKHFEKKELKPHVPAGCGDCHTPDGSGRRMLTAGFAPACAGCHRQDIEGEARAGDKGVEVLTLPGLDVDTLRQRGIAIGEWPDGADAGLTPFMAFLLAADPFIAPDLAGFAEGDLLDLREADVSRLQAVGRLAWAVKSLVFELGQRGQRALEERILKSLASQSPLDKDAFADLAGLLPAEVVGAAQNNWFPALAAEMAQYRSGRPPPLTAGAAKREPKTKPAPAVKVSREDILGAEDAAPPKLRAVQEDILGDDAQAAAESGEPRPDHIQEVSSEQRVMAGGWYRQGYAVLYRPSRHADAFLHGWLQLTAAFPSLWAKNLFGLLSKPKGPGMCTKCHSLDAGKNALRINWHIQPAEPPPGLTRFSHRAHFSLTDAEGCTSCHQIDKHADYLASFKGFDPKAFVGNFKPLTKAQCSDCHTEETAGNNCLACHKYHPTALVAKMPDTPAELKD